MSKNDSTKQCVVCGEIKPIDAFYRKGGRRCKPCFLRLKREYTRNNHVIWKRGQLRRYYGMTLEEYAKMMEDQHGGCAICKKPPTSRSLCVDHNHKTGAVRGLLCDRCNVAISVFDDAEIIQALVKYLAASSEKTGQIRMVERNGRFRPRHVETSQDVII